MEQIITREYLRTHPNEVFVFGDNLDGDGYGGAASLRDEPNTYGFITKKHPDNMDSSFYRPFGYCVTFFDEMRELCDQIEENPRHTFLISKLGAGLANKYNIWELVIEPVIRILPNIYPNVKLLFD